MAPTIPRVTSKKYWETYSSVAILDPAIATRNAGDEIISDASRTEIHYTLPHHFQTTLPTHERMGTRSWRLVTQSEHTILAGSNILTTALLLDRGWRYSLIDTLWVDNIISLATGWRSYRQERSLIGGAMLRRALSKTGIHSVRDEYSRKRLMDAGIRNVVNTACVTMWRLDTEALAALPPERAPRVVTTINTGHPSPVDRALAEALFRNYEEVHVWPQGIDDGDQVRALFGERAKILGPTLRAYDELLKSDGPLDFVGTRLHGGIRALQNRRRALIVAVDNRAAEIARDTNLPVVDGTSADELEDRIRNPRPIEVRLPLDAIAEWRGQFAR